MEEKLIPLAIGTLLGGLIGVFSLHYKLRVETKGKINIALFHLLEVWSLLGTVSAAQSEIFFNKLFEQFKLRFPKENLTEADMENMKIGAAKVVPVLMGAQSLGDDFYLDKYTAAVNDLAEIYPVQAFELNRNQALIRFLKGMDSFLITEEITESDRILVEGMTNLFQGDSLVEFENDLISLSKKSGLGNQIAVRRYVNRVKNRIQNIPESVFSEYIERVFAPMVQAHYDGLGIENPNNIDKA